jgi:photosystem II stability/assembly factor-like uncharacterized protein
MNAFHHAARAALALGLSLTFAFAASAAPSPPAAADAKPGLRATGSWVQSSTGLGNAQVLIVVVDPVKPTTLYAGTKGNGVFKSIDGAAHWSAAGSELSGPTTSGVVNAVAVDPITPATVYIGTEGGVYKSVDGGAHWAASSSGLTTTAVTAIAVDPSATAKVYAGTRNGGIFRSIDGGATWAAVNVGVDMPASVWGFGFAATNPASLWVSVSGPLYDQILFSTDAVGIGRRAIPVSTSARAPSRSWTS